MGYTAFKRVCITRLPTSITVSLTDLHPVVHSVVSRRFFLFHPAQLVFPSLLFFVKDEIIGQYPYGEVSLSVTQVEYRTVGKCLLFLFFKDISCFKGKKTAKKCQW